MDWNTLKYHFSKEYRLWNHKIYLDFGFHKLYKDWLKVRKNIDGIPKLKFYKGNNYPNDWCPYYMDIYASYHEFENKLFAIHIEPLGYKYKWGYCSYVYSPELVCVFNKKIRFTVRLECPKKYKDDEYSWWTKVVNLLTQKKV